VLLRTTKVSETSILIYSTFKTITMKLFASLFLLFFVIEVLTAQDRYEQKALSDANQMAFVYNQKNFNKYVEYLLASQYDNDTANKKGLAKVFSQNKDTSNLK
jgi:acyl-CoA synthetase (AMP-forming)/AMP-acid ligase II